MSDTEATPTEERTEREIEILVALRDAHIETLGLWADLVADDEDDRTGKAATIAARRALVVAAETADRDPSVWLDLSWRPVR